MLGVDCEVYSNNKRSHAVLCITEGIVVMLFKGNKQAVFNPISFNDVQTMFLAENVPSACALHLDEKIQGRVGQSHLIVESPSMGLLMRYVIEKNFKAEIDFCNQLEISMGGIVNEFYFEDLPIARKSEMDQWSNNVIRSVHVEDKLFQLEENTFTSDVWHKRFGVISNLGIFLFNEANWKQKPVFVSWDKFTYKLKDKKAVHEGMGNLFTFKSGDDYEYTYSIKVFEDMKNFILTIKRMQKEYQMSRKDSYIDPSPPF